MRPLELESALEVDGKVFMSTESGDGSSSTARGAAIADRNIRGLLAHTGILENKVVEPAVNSTTITIARHARQQLLNDERTPQVA